MSTVLIIQIFLVKSTPSHLDLHSLLNPFAFYSQSHFFAFFFRICLILFLYPATKVWRGIMLYPSVSVRLSVRPSVRPCSPFPIDNLSIYSRNFFKFCIHIVIGDEWYGIVNGQNPSIFNGVTALFRIGKMVSGLLFLYYS